MRQVGKYGRREPKRSAAIRFGDIWSGNFPQQPAFVDYLSRLGGGWQMLGNDRAGDCVSVTWANYRRLITGLLTRTPSYPSQDEVWQFYQTQNPGFDPNSATNGPGSNFDNGMDIQTACEYLHQNGGPDGAKLFAFARVNVQDVNEVKAAIATCGALWTGVNVYANNENEFGENQPWDFDATSQLAGGHSILTGGYGLSSVDTGALGGDEKFITWAEETSFTDNFWSHATEEVWACIWPEQLGTAAFEEGIDKGALAAAYHQVTGQTLVIP